ncbi:AraC-like DNA-binding protein [Pedobacter cryoconitis]|nr:AraC family transcriptional regulator [Pedobacter cryoconitis]MBB5645636.1 AraC-like DNA-binding protein [Pedobacter cryoconitis]
MNLDEINFGNAFLYSCYVDKALGHEQFVSEHVISYQISGETHIDHQNGVIILREGQVLISHRHQLAKAFKHPARNKEYRSLSVMLHTERLRKFGIDHHCALDKKYNGVPNIVLSSNPFLDGFFQSLVPYVKQNKLVSAQMETIKVNEILTLLLETNPELQTFLFDFSEPFKINLEEFMLNNYQYNVPIENFAKLTGRSLASFKRDFQRIFESPPRKWLKEKRLSEAYYLIKKNNRNPQIFILSWASKIFHTFIHLLRKNSG